MLVKMFFFALVLLQLLTALNARSLLDLPLKTDYGITAIKLEAVLTANGETYFLEEFISFNRYRQGKIEITSKLDSLAVHYATEQDDHFGTDKRLVVQETSCDLYKYSGRWDKTLPNINKPLLNLILLLGPSVFYRINSDSATWKQTENANVRGKSMVGYKMTLDTKIVITYYYKSESDVNAKKPSRIIFYGSDPGNPAFTANENIIIDIYTIDEYPNEVEENVQITPGVGCPIYISEAKSMPTLSSYQMQMIVQESVEGTSKSLTKDEYYIDISRYLIRRITTHLGITVDAIYDYNLGLIYVLQDQSCLIQPMGTSAPALDVNVKFSWKSLLWLDVAYFYLGEVDFESYPGFKVSAWEAVAYDMTLRSGKYDKVVTTLYMAKSDDKDLFNGYILVGSVRKAYKKGSNKNYMLVETTKRNFYDTRTTALEDQFNDRFQIGDCYKTPESRIDLAFKITCQSEGCLQYAEDRLTKFKYYFKQYILSSNISPLRIDDVSFINNKDNLIVYTTFLERPTYNSAFQRRNLRIDESFLNKLAGVDMGDENQCLEYQASYLAPISNVLYCSGIKNHACFHVEKGTSLVTSADGIPCKVYEIPLNNLNRFGEEPSLEQVHDFMLDKSRYEKLYFQGITYQIDDVIDKTQLFNDEAQFPFKVEIHGAKVKEDQNFRVINAENVANLGECYRECLNSDETICETFSFCQSSTGVECLITKSTFEAVADNVTVDKNCNTYSKNHYSDYFRISEKRFVSTASATINIPLYDCAAYCHSSKGCYSWQYCRGYCTFGGYFTDSNSIYDANCDIYIPKVSNKYQVTGKKIVEKAFHTEVNLNMAQCAAICYDLIDGDQKCKSFNYCPKGKTPSSCLLTSYSVKDANTKTIDSENCLNYEIIDDNRSKKANVNGSSKGMSGGAAFGIILFFLIGGLAVGFVIPIAYDKVKLLPSISSIRERFQRDSDDVGFGWSRQVNEGENRSKIEETTDN